MCTATTRMHLHMLFTQNSKSICHSDKWQNWVTKKQKKVKQELVQIQAKN